MEASGAGHVGRGAGERDLGVLLAQMAPDLLPGRWVFVVVPGPEAAAGLDVRASVVEPEGLSLVVAQEEADRAGLAYDLVLAWVVLTVHSALDAVGLTAAVSTALTAAGISCNVVAGRTHDHLLVPVERAAEALEVLRDLAGRG